MIESRKRRAQAFELYAQGRKTVEIAAHFQVTVKTARRWLALWRRNVTQQTADDIKLNHVATLNLALDHWTPKMFEGDESALDQVLKIMDRLAKYLGLYAPTKIDGTLHHSGSIQHHISREEMRTAVMDRLAALERQKNRLAAMDATPSEN